MKTTKEIMELELEHIAPYLPYGLNLFVIDEKLVSKLELLGDYVRLDVESDFDFHEVKPILRPLSDLLNNEVVESLGLAEVKRDWCEFYSRPTFTNDIPYRVYLELFKHHFDVFGLINKGLAIDKNTLQ